MADKKLSVTLTGKDELSAKLAQVRQKFDAITASGKPLGRRIREIEAQMLELARTGQSGSPMWDKMAEQARAYRSELDRVKAATRTIEPPKFEAPQLQQTGGMLAQLKKDLGTLGGIGGMAGQAGLGGVGAALGSLANPATAAAAGVAAVGKVMVDAGKSAADYQTHLAQLQSLTGLTTEAMEPIKKGALEMSKTFRASAPEIVDAMKMIGSQAPELLGNAQALMEVTKAANVLAEAAGIDVVTAATAITGTMNQMGAAASEATEIINTFAAASQQGSADVAYLNTAFEKAGTMAASSGMDFVQLAAAVETVAPKFSSAEVAGTNLSALLLKLSTQTNDKYKPAVVGMSKALENLAAAEMDDAEMKKLVGDSGVVMLKTLIDGRETFDKYSASLKGTNTAYEQMETNNNTLEGKIARLKGVWEAFLIQLGESPVMDGIISELEKVMNLCNTIIEVTGDVMTAFEEAFGKAGEDVDELNYGPLQQMCDTIRYTGEIVGLVVRLVGKQFELLKEGVTTATDWIGERWDEVKRNFGDVAFVKGIINAFNRILNAAANAINTLKRYWRTLKEWLGIEVNASDQDNQPTEILIANMDPEAGKEDKKKGDGTGGGTGGGGTKKKRRTTAGKSTVDYIAAADDGSLEIAEKKLQAYNDRLKKSRTEDKAALDDLREKIKTWTDEVERRKIVLHPELALEEGSLEYYDKQIKDLTKQRDLMLRTKVDPEAYEQINNDIRDMERRRKVEAIRVGVAPAAGSLAAMEADLKDLQKDLSDMLETDAPALSVKFINALIKNLQEDIHDKKVRLGIEYEPTIKAPDERRLIGDNAYDRSQSMDNARSAADMVASYLDRGIITRARAQALIDNINRQLQAIGLEPLQLKIDIDGTGIATVTEEIKKLHDNLGMLSGYVGMSQKAWIDFAGILGDENAAAMDKAGAAVATLGESLAAMGADGTVAKVGATLAAVGQIILGFATASVQAAELGPFGWLAFLGTGLGAIATVIGTINGYADGGIIEGATYHGDAMLARVNAGEMILNKTQQANLFRLLDQTPGGGSSLPRTITLRARGGDLVAVINTQKDKASRV